MTDVLDKLRKRYKGASFVSALPDMEVPWNPLTIGDYIEHTTNRIDSEEVIHNSIFESCVTDPYLVRNIGDLKAGTVFSVANGILAASFPNAIEEFNSGIHYYRMSVQETALEQLVMWVLTAFPAYTPEDVYGMDLNTFLHRVALAEGKLLRSGILTEPIFLTATEEEDKPVPPRRSKKPDLKKEYEQQDKPKKPKVTYTEPIETPIGTTVMPPSLPPDGVSPTVITRAEEQSHSNTDLHGQEEMLKDTLPFYQDYIEKMKHGKLKPGDIKTPDEREQEAEKRMEKNKEELAQQLAEQRKTNARRSSEIKSKFDKGMSRSQRRKLQK